MTYITGACRYKRAPALQLSTLDYIIFLPLALLMLAAEKIGDLLS